MELVTYYRAHELKAQTARFSLATQAGKMQKSRGAKL